VDLAGAARPRARHHREHPEILPALTTWIAETRPALGDLGYEGEADTITVAFKKPKGGELTDEQKDHNKAHNGKRAVGERGNSLLKTTSAPRGAVMYPPRSGERLEEVSLDLMASPELERERGR
jgi:hypothetical protein